MVRSEFREQISPDHGKKLDKHIACFMFTCDCKQFSQKCSFVPLSEIIAIEADMFEDEKCSKDELFIFSGSR